MVCFRDNVEEDNIVDLKNYVFAMAKPKDVRVFIRHANFLYSKKNGETLLQSKFL